MPYSMDPDENVKNAHSPSPLMSLHEQLIYKIAALDASMQSGFRRLDEKMDRFQSDLHDNQIETNDRINRVESETKAQFLVKRNRLDAIEKELAKRADASRLELIETRIANAETWQKIAMARVGAMSAVALVTWAIFGGLIEDVVVRIFS